MIPEPLQDRPLITIGACYAGPESDGGALVQPMRELGEQVMDTFQAMPPSGLPAVHMEPRSPCPDSSTTSLREAPQDAIAAFIDSAGPDSGSPLLAAELRQCGGAVGRPAEGGGALLHLDAEYVFSGIGLPMSPEMGQAINERIDAICQALGPWSTASRYFNFADRPTSLDMIFGPETLARLRDVKRRYDPDGLISGNHNVSLA